MGSLLVQQQSLNPRHSLIHHLPPNVLSAWSVKTEGHSMGLTANYQNNHPFFSISQCLILNLSPKHFMQFFPLTTQQSENVDKMMSPRFQGRNQGEKVANTARPRARSPGAPGFPTPGLLLWTTEVSHKKTSRPKWCPEYWGSYKDGDRDTLALESSEMQKLPGNASAADLVLDCA